MSKNIKNIELMNETSDSDTLEIVKKSSGSKTEKVDKTEKKTKAPAKSKKQVITSDSSSSDIDSDSDSSSDSDIDIKKKPQAKSAKAPAKAKEVEKTEKSDKSEKPAVADKEDEKDDKRADLKAKFQTIMNKHMDKAIEEFLDVVVKKEKKKRADNPKKYKKELCDFLKLDSSKEYTFEEINNGIMDYINTKELTIESEKKYFKVDKALKKLFGLDEEKELKIKIKSFVSKMVEKKD